MRNTAWGWAWCLALLAPGVRGAEPAQPSSLPAVEVLGNYENGVSSGNAASQGSVTSKLIEGRPILRTGEVLEFVPGLIVTQHSGDGKANQYFLRGFNLDHGTDFATYVDGMPVNMRSHAHGQGYTDLNFLIPELVRRIDYLKGPYYASEGDFSSAGAAHIGLADTLTGGVASLTLGQHDYQRALLANSFDFASGHLLYGLDLAHNNGPWDNPEGLRKFSANLRYSSGSASDGYSLTAMAYQSHWNSTDQVAQRAVAGGLIDRFGAIDPSDAGDTARYSLSFTRRKLDADGETRFNAYYVQSRLQLFSDFTYFLGNPAQGDQFEQAEQRKMAGFDLSRVWFGRVAGFDTENTIGLQSRYDRLSPVALFATQARAQLSTISSSRVREASAGLYVENVMHWLPWLRSIAGLRHDAYAFAVDSSVAGNSGRVSASITSPKLSLVFGPWAKTEFFLNYGQGFHSNDARGTTETVTPKEGLPASPVTPLVKTHGEEIGLRSEIVPGLQSSLALWRLDMASELVFAGDAGDTQPSRPSRRQGVEWNNHYSTQWGRLRALLDIDLAVSHARYTQDDPAGNTIPGSIAKVASAGLTLAQGAYSAALQLRYFGPRPLIEDNSVRSASTTLAYLRLGWQAAPRLRVSFDVYNLFNRQASDIDYYYASRLPGEAAGGVNDVHFHPVEPRNARLTLRYGF
ncbi:MAG TPA: TonB-dependent receptor [Burkholderiales bacterium]|jgi:hypothetical protein|nr:TonB-dependent receptor [Burkholderiales bacterium]